MIPPQLSNIFDRIVATHILSVLNQYAFNAFQYSHSPFPCPTAPTTSYVPHTAPYQNFKMNGIPSNLKYAKYMLLSVIEYHRVCLFGRRGRNGTTTSKTSFAGLGVYFPYQIYMETGRQLTLIFRGLKEGVDRNGKYHWEKFQC